MRERLLNYLAGNEGEHPALDYHPIVNRLQCGYLWAEKEIACGVK
jgi:hypothetical protein